LTFALALAACRKSAPEKAPLAGRTKRIVSLSPSTTETVCALGATSQLVGRSRFCDYPPEITSLPEVGGYVDPNLEAIVGLRPDLVVGARGPAGAAIVTQLEERGIATYFPRSETLAESDDMIRGLGATIDRAPEGEAIVTSIHARWTAIDTALAARAKRRVLLLFGVSPVVASGPASFGDEVLAHAHGTNVVTQGGTYPLLDLETVVRLDPDVIVDAAVAEEHGAQRIAADAPGWRDVRAVREGRVIAMADERMLRPGPRIAEGVEALARALYPDVKL
jgi:iron complex transport system substrate-binding protein